MSLDFTAALAIGGALFVLVALGAAALRDRPVTVAIFYLALGVALGPFGVGAMAPRIDDPWLLRLTEVAVLGSLFASGLKVRAPWRSPGLRAAVLLAGPGLAITAALVAIGAHLALGMAWDAALLLGAVMAPTDPVLASEVALRSPRDENALRAALTVEAGLNDGTAFPLVALGVLAVTSAAPLDATTLATWALDRVLWAVPAGLVIGAAIGWTTGRVAFVARARAGRTEGIDELLAVGVVALSYVAAEAVHAWGFLAVFASGVALRRAELRVVASAGLPDERVSPRLELDERAPADALMQPEVSDEARRHPTVAAATVLHDTSRLAGTLERVGEIAVVVCAGAMLARSFDPAGLALAAVLFLVARPAGVLVTLARSPFAAREKAVAGWLGIRGAGTLYYLAWAANEGALGGSAAHVADLAITCVATSIVLHGVTATPLVRRIDRAHATTADAGLAEPVTT
ncbi:cation:proton antiporter [Sandaracinus amylolyticus]|uniref:Cation/H+ exchanger transmembrane domain-containing protein n=1 Tax=Sandaracinus amylolyticus TaxID=927083 RepID=A0A0F6W7A3_9BACT|nr:cation:proton antiporter [Sandaracinus amylolyticus]AKF09306.1 hypothetical protein DB32_006455 [Sandaracinus amylolyticus]